MSILAKYVYAKSFNDLGMMMEAVKEAEARKAAAEAPIEKAGAEKVVTINDKPVVHNNTQAKTASALSSPIKKEEPKKKETKPEPEKKEEEDNIVAVVDPIKVEPVEAEVIEVEPKKEGKPVENKETVSDINLQADQLIKLLSENDELKGALLKLLDNSNKPEVKKEEKKPIEKKEPVKEEKAIVLGPPKKEEAPEVKKEEKKPVDLVKAYPLLTPLQKIVTECGYEVTFFQRDDKLIAGVVSNGQQVIGEKSFIVDLDSVCLGREKKFFAGFIAKTVSMENIENYPAFNIGDLEIFRKHICSAHGLGAADLSNKLYNSNYVVVNSFVDLLSFPEEVDRKTLNKIVERLYTAFGAGVFNQYRGKGMDIFAVKKYMSESNYIMVSGDEKIHVRKGDIITGVDINID